MRRNLKKLACLLMVLLVTVALSSVAFAAPTQIDITWNGAGGVGATVGTGDSTTTFNTGGNQIIGSFTSKDSNDNPYNYQIDTNASYLNASVANGGFIEMSTDRLTSQGMYGPAGQESYSFVNINSGTASMAARTSTNYASLSDPTYGYQLTGGHNITVDGANAYVIQRYVGDGQGNSGEILAGGNGSAVLDNMNSGASGNGGVSFGLGGGCYTDATFNATGAAGTFQVTGIGTDSVNFGGLGASSGGGSLSFVANWVNNFNIGNYSLTAN
jgi:hypothetical protein